MTTTCPFCGAASKDGYTKEPYWFECGVMSYGKPTRNNQTPPCITAEVARLTRERDEARAEVARLKAGGCARYQRTTQFCAEAVALQERVKRLEEFANRFLHPEDLGFTVTAWIRDDAREALGMPAAETPRSTKP
jgi:hypothetical protein